MKKSQITTGLLISALLINGVTAYNYKVDTNKLEREISKQEKLITYSNYDKLKQDLEMIDLNKTIQAKTNEINSLKLQLEKAQHDSESPLRSFNVEASAYVSFCTEGCTGKTSSGINVSKSILHNGMRIIAVDPSIIKLHSIVVVETTTESFIAYAADTGGGINGYEIDLLVSVNDTQKAFQFGKQQVKVTVLREGLMEV